MAMQSQEKVLEKLRTQLGVAVRSVQWSYAIFWSLSTTQQGVLEWGEGYYNGDIMTRTGPASEGYADKLGFQRSQQLRELYKSLLEEDSEGGSTTTCPALSPEDLTDLEWYYLVCMSFVFQVGQSLPGKALANGQSVWLCNAPDADSKVFSRSLLAKSASVETVICFPHSGGVIELGVTDLVSEDPNLIQRVKTALLEFAKPTCFESSSDHHNADYDKDRIGTKIHDMNQEMPEPEALPTQEIKFEEEMLNELRRNMSVSEEFNNMGSPDDFSDNCCGNCQQEDSFMLEGGNDIEANSLAQNRHLGDDHVLNCGIHDSCISSGHIAQAFSGQEKTLLSFEDKHMDNQRHLKELQDCNNTMFCSLELGNNDQDEDDLHYKRAVATVLQSSNHSVREESLYNAHKPSTFVPWKKELAVGRFVQQSPQRALKKVLLTVPLMIAKNPLGLLTKDSKEANSSEESQPDISCTQHAFSSKGREDDNYLVLRSMVPPTNKIDKTAILNDTIEHLKELEARVEELESCVNQSDSEAKSRRKFVDTFDNSSTSVGNKMCLNKRKADDIIGENEAEPELLKVAPVDNNTSLDVNVTINGQEVLISICCPWREYLLLDIMDTMNNLSLDAHTVQSTTTDGILSINLKSKFRGAAFAPVRMIKQALRRAVGLC